MHVKEWTIIGLSGCITLYGAWLYIQPRRKLPPITSNFNCKFELYGNVFTNKNEQEFVYISANNKHLYPKNEKCIKHIESTEDLSSTECCFNAIFNLIKSELVTTDEITLDSICSIFVYTYPKIAFTHKDMVIKVSLGGMGSDHTTRISDTIKYIIKDKDNKLDLFTEEFKELEQDKQFKMKVTLLLRILHDLIVYPSMINNDYYKKIWNR